MDPLPGVDIFLGDFSDQEVPQILLMLRKKVDVVMSDMAPFTTGVQSADHIRILNLVEGAILFSDKVLKKGESLSVSFLKVAVGRPYLQC